MIRLAREDSIENLSKVTLSTCKHKLKGKVKKKPFEKAKVLQKAYFLLQLVYLDIYGPVSIVFMIPLQDNDRSRTIHETLIFC